MSSLPIRVLSALGCDDIREETSGKYMAIGLFGPSVMLLPDPALGESDRSFRAHFLLVIDVLQTGEHELIFRLHRGTGGGGVANVTVVFKATGTGIPFPLGPLTMRIPDEEKTLVLSVRDGDKWIEIGTWDLEMSLPDRVNPDQQPTGQ